MGIPINKVNEVLKKYNFNNELKSPNSSSLGNECPICHQLNDLGNEYCQSCGTLIKLKEETKEVIEVKQ